MMGAHEPHSPNHSPSQYLLFFYLDHTLCNGVVEMRTASYVMGLGMDRCGGAAPGQHALHCSINVLNDLT